MNLEIGAILLMGRGRGGIVGGVKKASDTITGLGGNPEIGATGVQYDLESLRRSANGDFGEVLVQSVLAKIEIVYS